MVLCLRSLVLRADPCVGLDIEPNAVDNHDGELGDSAEIEPNRFPNLVHEVGSPQMWHNKFSDRAYLQTIPRRSFLKEGSCYFLFCTFLNGFNYERYGK